MLVGKYIFIPSMQKHQLIIMRHAKSDWREEGRPDFDRPLAKRGRKAAKQIGRWLKQQQFGIDQILCSPALRAKQTGQLVLEQLKLPQKSMLYDSRIYEASLSDLIALIHQYSEDIHTLLVIGHNPGLDQLLCHLSKESPPLSRSGKLLTTAAVAVLDFGTAPISVKTHQAHLQYLVRPKEL